MEYNDELLVSDEDIKHLQKHYDELLLPDASLKPNLGALIPHKPGQQDDFIKYLASAVNEINKSLGYLQYIKSFLPRLKNNAKNNIADIENLIRVTKNSKDILLSLNQNVKSQNSYVPYTPNCRNYYSCFTQFGWCQYNLLKWLLLLNQVCHPSLCGTINKICMSTLDALSIPLKFTMN